MKYVIEADNVSKKIDKNLILDRVSFKLEKGKIYGLVGANGSGKSTLLKIIMGLSKFEGKIIINGLDTRKHFKEIMKDVGGIVDYVSFYDYLTAEENLRYFALLYGVSMERVYEVMKLVKLDVDKKLVKHFSLGMKQRLGIAISLLKDPSILILDEPTNGLDPRGIKELRELLLSFDKTIIVSSHLISEIEKISDEILFINKKKVIEEKVKNDNNKIKFSIIKNNAPKEVIYRCRDNNEIYTIIKKLVEKNVPVFRVAEEGRELESVLISLMEDE